MWLEGGCVTPRHNFVDPSINKNVWFGFKASSGWVQSAFEYNVDEHLTFIVIGCAMCIFIIFVVCVLFRSRCLLAFAGICFSNPPLIFPSCSYRSQWLDCFPYFGKNAQYMYIVKILFFCDICKSRLLDSELLVHCCTRLSVGMTWDWSKQRANDRYKDHLDSRWAINLPGTWLWWLVLSTAFKEHGFAAVLADTLFMIYL